MASCTGDGTGRGPVKRRRPGTLHGCPNAIPMTSSAWPEAPPRPRSRPPGAALLGRPRSTAPTKSSGSGPPARPRGTEPTDRPDVLVGPQSRDRPARSRAGSTRPRPSGHTTRRRGVEPRSPVSHRSRVSASIASRAAHRSPTGRWIEPGYRASGRRPYRPWRWPWPFRSSSASSTGTRSGRSRRSSQAISTGWPGRSRTTRSSWGLRARSRRSSICVAWSGGHARFPRADLGRPGMGDRPPRGARGDR
ncbi:MAG: hypothetical protein HW391_957 [Chloroflexi bacterium]|nr:hypothetical protein [Chloroflexota bacterium]